MFAAPIYLNLEPATSNLEPSPPPHVTPHLRAHLIAHPIKSLIPRSVTHSRSISWLSNTLRNSRPLRHALTPAHFFILPQKIQKHERPAPWVLGSSVLGTAPGQARMPSIGLPITSG